MASSPEIVVRYRSDTSALGKGLSQVSSHGATLSKAMKAAGVAAVGAFAAVSAGAAKAVSDASNLSEQVNKANVVFGKSGGEVVKWSETLAGSFGLSSRAALEAAGTFGNMLVPMGYTRDEAGNVSTKMVELAGDMASFNNASPADTLEALRAGLAGESEPLRKYGVFLSDARLKEEAMREGLYKGKGALDASAKAHATYALILKDTADTQGDFERTSSSLANAQRTISAEMENISASIGAALLPAVAKAASGVAGFLASFGEAKGAAAKFHVVIDAVKTAASGIFGAIRGAVAGIDWAAVWAQAKGIGQGFLDALNRVDWDGLWAQAKGLGTGLQNALAAVNWSAVGATIGNGIADAVALAMPKVKEALQKALDIAGAVDWTKIGKAAGPGLAAAVVTAFATITDPVFWIKNWDLALAVAALAFGGPIGKVAGKLAAPLTKLGADLVLTIGVAMERRVGTLAEILLEGMLRLPGVVARAAAPLLSAVEALMGRLGRLAVFTLKVLGIQAVVDAVGNVVSYVVGKLRDLVGAISGAASGAASAAARVGTAIYNAIVNFLRQLPGKAGEFMGQIPGAIAAAGAAAAGAAYSIGVSIVQGMVNGIASMAGSVASKAKEVVMGAVNAAKGVLHMQSPSRVWADLGADTIAGYILGITEQQPKLDKKTAEAVGKALDAARERVQASQDSFRAAFEKLGDFAARAFEGRTSKILDNIGKRFDATVSKWEALGDALTPAEKELARLDAQEGARSRAAAIDAAQSALASAETEKDRLDAIEQLRQAHLAQRVFQLQQEAAQERTARDARVAEEIKATETARERAVQNAEEARRQQGLALDEQLAQLQERLAKHPEEHDKIQKQIVKLLKSYGVDYAKVGQDLGSAFARGLRQSRAEVERAAESLAKVVARYLPHSPAEEGPLSRTDFFRGFGEMLAANIASGAGAVGRAAGSLAGAAAAPLAGPSLAAPAMDAAGVGPIGVKVFIGETELRGIVRHEVTAADNRTAQALLAGLS